MVINWIQALTDYISDETESYESIANKYGVSKQSVLEHATNEDWQALRNKVRTKVLQKLPVKVSESLLDVKARHLKIIKELEDKAIDFTRDLNPNNFRDARDTLLLSINLERKILGMEDKNYVNNNDESKVTFLEAMKQFEEKINSKQNP